MNDKIFCDGLIMKLKRDGAPEWVKGGLAIKVAEFIPFLEKHVKPDGFVNIDILESKGGKIYASLNTWSPKKESENDDNF